MDVRMLYVLPYRVLLRNYASLTVRLSLSCALRGGAVRVFSMVLLLGALYLALSRSRPLGLVPLAS